MFNLHSSSSVQKHKKEKYFLLTSSNMGQLCYLIGLGKPNTSGPFTSGADLNLVLKRDIGSLFSTYPQLRTTTRNPIFKLTKEHTVLTCNPLHHKEGPRNFAFFLPFCYLFSENLISQNESFIL